MRKHVFADLTGRRRQAAVILGAGLGAFLLLGLTTIMFGLLTSTPVPLPGWPETVQRGAEIGPPPAPAPTTPAPRASATPKTTTASTAATATPTPEASRQRGNGHGRPSKTSGKP